MFRTKLSVEGKISVEIHIRCEGCGVEHKGAIAAPILFYYDEIFKRFEPDFEEQRKLVKSAMPDGWRGVNQSKMFSGEGHYTEWTDYFCPECSISQKVI